jgi:TolB-like protein
VVEEADGDLMGDGVNIAARLEGIAKPGAICLSEDAYRQVKGRLDLAVTDLGPTQLRNIADPIRVYSLDIGAPAAPIPAPEKSAPPRLSIVVLPFGNIGGDPEQEHFVDGVTESLTTDLSRIRGAVVIACNTAFSYKGNPLDLKTIGRELNVRYALEGSVQRGGNRMRVNVQLVDAESGNHLWAERFDKPPRRSPRHAGRNRRAAGQYARRAAEKRRGATRGTGSEPRLDRSLFSRSGLAQ